MSGRALRADAARNYERILGAAVAAFEEIGPEATLEEIAERAQVSVMTLYRRFRSRDQLIRAVFDHVLITEIEPMTTAHTDDPWQDLVGALTTVADVLAQRQAIHSLALEFQTFANETAHRLLRSLEPLISRAIDAKVVRPELQVRDLAAVIMMTAATVHPGDPHSAGHRRYLAILLDGLRPSSTALPRPLHGTPPAHPPTNSDPRSRGGGP
ncbi:TetR/AcrR family transcriptional regulator [Spongiactinospora rosea]|uniref:TetR/AcrR family transcriptional regulator n=1 Tax=Spongiactinospora rosea TaxID=2248750 RepID=UPI0018F572EF|nr:TetR/AcrR family transcriptional regulator [Spongiactinospora rosea]